MLKQNYKLNRKKGTCTIFKCNTLIGLTWSFNYGTSPHANCNRSIKPKSICIGILPNARNSNTMQQSIQTLNPKNICIGSACDAKKFKHNATTHNTSIGRLPMQLF